MSETKNSRLCIVAAGSGGHILPALQLGRIWLNQHQTGQIMVFSSGKKLDAKILASSAAITKTIPLSINNYTRLGVLKYPLQCIQLMSAFVKSLYNLIRFRPSQIISTGSIHTIPVALAAKLLRIPIHLYELNAVPGKAITFLAPFATSLNGVFTASKKYFGEHQKKFNHVAYPLKYNHVPEKKSKESLIEQLNTHRNTSAYVFNTSRKTLLLLGGSQGSQKLNEWLHDFLIRHPEIHQKIQIIHQTGHSTYDWLTFYNNITVPAYVFDFINDLTPSYQLADLAICRAGAGTLFELSHFKKPSIIVPLFTSTTSHQYDNAVEMAHVYPHLYSIISEKNLKKNFMDLDSLVLEKVNSNNIS